jgi:RNA polymerase sigma-70 factor (ECF subfamily)
LGPHDADLREFGATARSDAVSGEKEKPPGAASRSTAPTNYSARSLGHAVSDEVIMPALMAIPSELVPTAPVPLLGRVAGGDREAVRECIARYGSLVYSLARRFEPARGDVDDAVQEIFVDLWKSAGRFDVAIASEPTFVAMVARRRLIDRRRARGRRPSTDPISEVPPMIDPGTQPDVCAEASQAARALSQLRPEQRDVLVMATCGGLSHSEIAARTGMPLGTVKAHARRGLLSIRAALLGVPSEENA